MSRRQQVLRWIFCLHDGIAGGIFVFGGLIGLNELGKRASIWIWHQDPWKQSLLECSGFLAIGLFLVTAGALLAMIRPPRCWKVAACAHFVCVISAGLTVAALLADLPRRRNHMDMSGAIQGFLVVCAAVPGMISLVATIILACWAVHSSKVGKISGAQNAS